MSHPADVMVSKLNADRKGTVFLSTPPIPTSVASPMLS